MTTRLVRDRPNKLGWCHPLLKEVAIGFAQALYERLAQNNLWYEHNRNRAAFVSARWPDLLPNVRTHLSQMLGMPTLPESEKAKIYDALVADNQFRLGRARGQRAKVEKAMQKAGRYVH